MTNDTETNIITMPTPLHTLMGHMRNGYARIKRSDQEWIEGTLEIAFALAEARKQFLSNSEFGAWIGENALDFVSPDDRAALINMVSDAAIAVTRIVLSETMRRSWQWIWREEIEPRLRQITKTAPILGVSATPEKVVAFPPREQTMTPQLESKSAPRPIDKRSALFGFDRGAEVHAIYRNADMRNCIAKVVRGRVNDLWPMILTAIDTGFLTETNYANHRLSLRILFPHNDAATYCRQIDLMTTQARKRVREFILPAMIANKEAILKDPSQIGKIMHSAEFDARRKAASAAAEVKNTERRAAMPKHQYEIQMYGEQFWPNPNPDISEYSYDQCRAACWYFYETNQLYEVTRGGESAKSRAMMMRFSTRWFSQYADRELAGEDRTRMKMVYRLIHAMAHAMERNPAGESKRPPFPTTDGVWP